MERPQAVSVDIISSGKNGPVATVSVEGQPSVRAHR
jgi:hypothetical protein